MNNDMVTTRLELIAAKAKQLAQDHAANRLYPDDLASGLRDLSAQIGQALRDAAHH